MLRVYNFMMAFNQRLLLAQHRKLLFSEEAKKLYKMVFNETGVFRATSLSHIDEHYSR